MPSSFTGRRLYFVQSFRRRSRDTIQFSTDAQCNAGTSYLLKDRTTYAMSDTACKSTASLCFT